MSFIFTMASAHGIEQTERLASVNMQKVKIKIKALKLSVSICLQKETDDYLFRALRVCQVTESEVNPEEMCCGEICAPVERGDLRDIDGTWIAHPQGFVYAEALPPVTASPSPIDHCLHHTVNDLGNIPSRRQTERKERMPTSWLDTSEWSLRVIPSPIADFINRDSEGSTLIGG
ncbi:hypothetical protein JZ751_012125 [Albula glossodonta]|uniref:Uncharacterized protein n=1 Tax=Albula glossodonta TaxID=121402 RepID=A0A8T2PRS9_9TELE|nr:hypothetical protein JZ751_012125 [Albula glossodonta]